MYFIYFCILIIVHFGSSQEIYETDVNFRIEPGSRTCFFEKGKAGQTLEAQYQVIDGQHGDLDISFDIIDPNGANLLADYKKSENSVIMDLELDGDYVFCMDNTHSVMNSKLVFVYVLIEDKVRESDNDTEVAVGGNVAQGDDKEEEILEWKGTTPDGDTYYVAVTKIAESLKRTLKRVVKARQLLDIYGAIKARDSYMAFEDTFIVDVWSGFQIIFMMLVGLIQVYMIKQLFNKPVGVTKSFC